MPRLVCIFLVFAVVNLHAAAAEASASGQKSMHTVNAVSGDQSWVDRYGVAPTPLAQEDDRLTTHLAWVEMRLRRHTPDHLTVTQRAARLAMLDALHDYIEDGVFPRRVDTVAGRRPRFVDSEGRHCAVGFLIAASGNADLVASIQDRYEYSYVADMQEPALLAWADSHGFTVDELALIQPAYRGMGGDVKVPPPDEEKRRRRAAKVPRDLTADHIKEAIAMFPDRTHMQRCLPHRTGQWSMELEVAVKSGLNLGVSVKALRLSDGENDADVAVCFTSAVRDLLRTYLAQANFRFRKIISESVARPLVVHNSSEVKHALMTFDRHSQHGRPRERAALAACLKDFDQIVRVPLRISWWNGQVSMRWDEIHKSTKDMSPADRTGWYCIQDVLGYGRLAAYGLQDVDIELDVRPDGSKLLR